MHVDHVILFFGFVFFFSMKGIQSSLSMSVLLRHKQVGGGTCDQKLRTGPLKLSDADFKRFHLDVLRILADSLKDFPICF